MTDGDHDATIVTATPFRLLLAFLAHHSAIILTAGAYHASGAVTTMVGSGLHRLTGINAPLSLGTERFPQWWGAARLWRPVLPPRQPWPTGIKAAALLSAAG